MAWMKAMVFQRFQPYAIHFNIDLLLGMVSGPVTIWGWAWGIAIWYIFPPCHDTVMITNSVYWIARCYKCREFLRWNNRNNTTSRDTCRTTYYISREEQHMAMELFLTLCSSQDNEFYSVYGRAIRDSSFSIARIGPISFFSFCWWCSVSEIGGIYSQWIYRFCRGAKREHIGNM